MSESDARDRPGLNLLIQLFGREVLDRLARAGYGDESAIAAAGPDRLASTSGVSLPLAQRIVAVVQHGSLPNTARGAAQEGVFGAGGVEAPGTPGRGGPDEREPGRRGSVRG